MKNLQEQAREAALHQLIAVHAYGLWESHGRPHGHHLMNWHQAEQEILDCLGPDVLPRKGNSELRDTIAQSSAIRIQAR